MAHGKPPKNRGNKTNLNTPVKSNINAHNENPEVPQLANSLVIRLLTKVSVQK